MTQTTSFTLDFRTQRFQDAAKGLEALGKDIGASPEGFATVVSQELKKFLETVAEALAQRHGNPYPNGTSTTTLSKRSGDLVESIRNSVFVKEGDLNSIVGSIGGVFYLKVHEYGKTIYAKNVKYLTIPLPAALNSNGTPKKKSAREWENTFVLKSKAGNLLIVQKVGRNIVPLYVLKTSVKIPARAQVRTTVSTALPYFVDTITEKLLGVLLGSVKKTV